jgi:hypothetical protein
MIGRLKIENRESDCVFLKELSGGRGFLTDLEKVLGEDGYVD